MFIILVSTCTCENGKQLGSIIGDSVITCNEIIEVTKTVPTKILLTKTIPTKLTPTKTTPAKTYSLKTLPRNFNKKT